MLSKLGTRKEYSIKGHKLINNYRCDIEASFIEANEKDLEEAVDYIYFKDRKIAILNNSFVCVANKINFAATEIQKIGDNQCQLIIVDELFNNLSTNAKKFVIYHEIGHYENGDLLDYNERDFNQEEAADNFALKV